MNPSPLSVIVFAFAACMLGLLAPSGETLEQQASAALVEQAP